MFEHIRKATLLTTGLATLAAVSMALPAEAVAAPAGTAQTAGTTATPAITAVATTATAAAASTLTAAAATSAPSGHGSPTGTDRSDPVPPQEDPDGALPNLAASTPPPTCISADDHHPAVGLATVTVHNNCRTPQRVKVLIAFWFDSSCTTIAPRGSFAYDYANSARFDGLTAC